MAVGVELVWVDGPLLKSQWVQAVRAGPCALALTQPRAGRVETTGGITITMEVFGGRKRERPV